MLFLFAFIFLQSEASTNGKLYVCDAVTCPSDNVCDGAAQGTYCVFEVDESQCSNDDTLDCLIAPLQGNSWVDITQQGLGGAMVAGSNGMQMNVSPRPWTEGDQLVATSTTVSGDDWAYALAFSLVAPLRNKMMMTPWELMPQDQWELHTNAFTDCLIKLVDGEANDLSTQNVYAQLNQATDGGPVHTQLQYLEEAAIDLVCLMTDLDMSGRRRRLSGDRCTAVREVWGISMGTRCDCWTDAYIAMYGSEPNVEPGFFSDCSVVGNPTIPTDDNSGSDDPEPSSGGSTTGPTCCDGSTATCSDGSDTMPCPSGPPVCADGTNALQPGSECPTDDTVDPSDASEEECTAEPMSPGTNDQGLVPQGNLLLVPEANLPEGVDCGDYVFEPMTYEQVPDECCNAEGTVSVLSMAEAFAETVCVALDPIDTGAGQVINVNLAGGCSDEGDFFYGEQCGGSDFGPFSYLSDGTFLGLGNCVQSATECECNGYVNTVTAGCFNVAAFEGSGERYFMRVDDPVCAAPELYPCPECDGMYPEPLTAEEIVHTQDEGAVSLNFGTDPAEQLGPKFQFAENIVVTTVVQSEAPYNAKSSLAGTFGQFDSGVPLNFVDVLTFPAEDAPLDEGAISVIQFVYTTWVDWVSDTMIGQKFYLGTRGEDLTNDVLWGWCIFEFTGSELQREILPAHATGYQITHDYFCYGAFEYCEFEATAYFEDLGWNLQPAEESTEAPCEDDPEWANGRGLTCADVYESYVSLDKVCTSNGLLTNCCAMCAMLEMRTTQAVEDFDLCPEGMMYNAEAYFLPVGASEGMEALCDNAARACARNLECDTAFFATTDCCYSDSAEESTEGPSTCGCGEEIGTAFSNLESELQTQMAALMSETLPAQLDALLSVTLTEQIQLALAAALPERFVTAEDFAMLEDKVGDLEMDNNDVMNGMSDMATCMADIAGSMGGGGDDSYEMTDAPAETAAPTEYWQTIGRLLEGGNNKCSTSDNDRAFRLSFTSLENCLTRCRDDDRCQFASTNFMSESSTKYCIGCINLTQAADGWMAYEMLNDRRQLSNVKQLSEIERLRAENQRLRAELAEARRN